MKMTAGLFKILMISMLTTLGAYANAMADSFEGFYSTKQPYQVPAITTYSTPPAGFELFSVQHVARHGSRLLTSAKYDDLSLQLWQKAEAEDGLTEGGKKFGEVLQLLIAHHEKNGYGNLSDRGRSEHYDMAQRTYNRDQALFDEAAAKGLQFDVFSSGQDRAVDSGINFIDGLKSLNPKLASSFKDMVYDEAMLYFHSGDKKYRDYLKNDLDLEAAVNEIYSKPEVVAASRTILQRVYTDAFLDKLEKSEITLKDRSKGKSQIRDIPSAASALYNLYIILPGIPELGIDLTPYVDSESAKIFAFATDAEQFYKKGPGFAGKDVTYRMAQPLIDSFFANIDQRIDGEKIAGAFRFAHAEEVMPFASLLKLKGSEVQAPVGQLYSYENNPWRGAEVVPMAANVQWDVYSDGKDKQLVRMLYNENEVHFAPACHAVPEHEYFYELEELRKCLAPAK